MVFKHHTNNFSAKSVHKKAIVRTQKCTHVYTKMYACVHFYGSLPVEIFFVAVKFNGC